MTVKLVTDSTSYIDDTMLEYLDIKKVNLSVHFPDESYYETDVDYDYFYEKIERDGVIPTSSQPSPGDMYKAFMEIISRGEQALGIFLSSKMSGTYHAALRAKEMVLQEYPQAVIEIIDSKTNCMALGLPVIEAAKAAKDGKSIQEVVSTARHIIDRVNFYFVPATLDYLKKGGRIGGASALLGSLLRIRPILFVNNGMTDLYEKVRGTRTAVAHILRILNDDYIQKGLTHLIVHHINDPENGNKLAQELAQKYGCEVPVMSIGPVIGTHVGPGAIGIVYSTEQ